MNVRSFLGIGALVAAAAAVGVLVGRKGPSAAAPLEVRADAATPSAAPSSAVGSSHGFDVQRLERVGVRFQPARRRPGGTTIDVVGALGLNRERVAQVSTHAAGRVVRIQAFVGQQVRQGQVLAIVESPAIGDAVADFISRRAELQSARQNLARQQDLMRQQLTTGREFEMAQTAVRTQEAELLAAQTRLRAYGVSTANAAASGAPLVAPIEGQIIARQVLLGSWVQPETEAFTIADLSHLWADLDVYESDLALTREGDRVQLDVPALGLRDVPGTVHHIHAEIDRETRMGHMRVVVDNPTGTLRAGLSVTAHIHTQPGAPSLRLPLEAVREREGRPHVLQRNGSTASWQPVETGIRRGGEVEITAGIAEGDVVAMSGLGLIAGSL